MILVELKNVNVVSEVGYCRYIHYVKRYFKPVLTKEAKRIISSYYQLQRRSATQNAGLSHGSFSELFSFFEKVCEPLAYFAARTTVRMLESLIRLAQGMFLSSIFYLLLFSQCSLAFNNWICFYYSTCKTHVQKWGHSTRCNCCHLMHWGINDNIRFSGQCGECSTLQFCWKSRWRMYPAKHSLNLFFAEPMCSAMVRHIAILWERSRDWRTWRPVYSLQLLPNRKETKKKKKLS